MIDTIELHWSPELEADIKSTCTVSDVHGDFMRDMRCKTILIDGSVTKRELWPGSGKYDLYFPVWASRYLRIKEMKRRASLFGLDCNEEGSISVGDVITVSVAAHKESIVKKNSLWKRGNPVEVIFSADALQTARGEKHTVAAIRDLNMRVGTTSAFQYVQACFKQLDR